MRFASDRERRRSMTQTLSLNTGRVIYLKCSNDFKDGESITGPKHRYVTQNPPI